MRIILASASQRRKELMEKLNIKYEVLAYDHEEIFDGNKTIYDQCMDVSYQKGKVVFDDIPDDVIVISCDTIVALDSVIYGKPKDNDDAFNMIKKLQGRTHEVVTALTVFSRINGVSNVEQTYDKALVTVDKMCDEEIKEWVDTGLAIGKAGSYGIQDSFGRFISKIEGDYYTIVGLPLNKLYNILKKLEVYDELR
jgi:septum formation protein